MKPRDWRRFAALLAVFVASFAVIHSWSGASPALWLDTLNDEREVRLCVVQGSCSLLGQSASINGLFLAGGWLHLRALLFSLGLGLNGVHLLLQACDALGVVALVVAGDGLAGAPVGALAAFVLMWLLGTTAATREAVYNLSTMAFLGAVMLALCAAAVRRPGYRAAVLLGLLAAVMTDSHVSAAPAGMTAVVVTLLTEGKRLRRAAVALTIFVAGTFAIAPLEVLANLAFVRHAGGHRAATTLPTGELASVVSSDPIAACALLGVAVWLFAVVGRRHVLRRELDVVVATTAPMLLAFVFAMAHGVGDSGGRYLAHLKAAAALSVAVPFTALLRWVLARAGRPREVKPWLAGASPWVAAFAILLALWRGQHSGPGRLPLFTMDDLEAITHVLRDERGWSQRRALRDVRTTESQAMLQAFQEYETGWRGSPDTGGHDEERTNAYVLKVDAAALPARIPPSWRVLARSERTATLVAFTPSRIDWERADVCSEQATGAPRCRGHAADGPGAPLVGGALRIVMEAPCVPGAPGLVFMPRIPGQCGGVVDEVDGQSSHVSLARRHATLENAASTVTLSWGLHSAECPEYYGPLAAPFFVEGAGEGAVALQVLFEWYER